MANIKITTFRDVMPRSLISVNVLKEPAGIFRVEDSSAEKRDAAVSFKMLVPICKTNAYIW